MCCLIFFAEFLTQQYLKYNMDIRIFCSRYSDY